MISAMCQWTLHYQLCLPPRTEMPILNQFLSRQNLLPSLSPCQNCMSLICLARLFSLFECVIKKNKVQDAVALVTGQPPHEPVHHAGEDEFSRMLLCCKLCGCSSN